ncbi:unnamed protein product [Coregonus sp. 'balchen']|nr:unnamed protein product [Coregonus sp. 'balchen']
MSDTRKRSSIWLQFKDIGNKKAECLHCKTKLVTAENQWTVTVQKVKELVAALCSAMDRKFLRMEYNTVLSETTLLDPRFKKLAFSDRRAVDEALQRISAAAAAKCTPSSQPAPPLQGQVEEEQQTSAVWRLFDDRATGDASRRNPTADAIMEVTSFPVSLSTATLGPPSVTLVSSGADIEVSINDPVLRISEFKDVYNRVTYNITYWKEGQEEWDT